MRSIDVYGKKIKIYHKDLSQSGGVAGIYLKDKGEIWIEKRLKGDEYKITLLHELIHAIWDRTGLTQTNTSIDVEELCAENIARFIVDTFKISLTLKR